MNKYYLGKSAEGKSTKYYIVRIYFIVNIFSNSKIFLLCLFKVQLFE